MRIGVNVGGTNIDAVLTDGVTVVSSIKALTVANVGAGVVAAIEGVLKQVCTFRDSLKELEIDAPLFISQNDGTWRSAARVERYPVPTVASGPTNCMRGAACRVRVKAAGALAEG